MIARPTDRRALPNDLRDDHANLIRLIAHDRNRGIGAARNSLLDAACGKYLWFVDPDDTMANGALAHLGRVIAKHAPDIVLCDFSRDSGQKIATFSGSSKALGTSREDLLCGVFSARKLHCWSKISRRKLWSSDLRFPEGKRFEDITAIPHLLLRAESYYHVPEAWIYYRQHAASLTAIISRSKGFDRAGQDEMAMALGSFHLRLETDLGDVSPDTRFAIAHFMAKIFRQIGYDLLKEKLRALNQIKLSTTVRHYRQITEAASPIGFVELAQEYRARKQLTNFLFLQLFCWIADLDQSA